MENKDNNKQFTLNIHLPLENTPTICTGDIKRMLVKWTGLVHTHSIESSPETLGEVIDRLTESGFRVKLKTFQTTGGSYVLVIY